ncbi:unnamed protein product [Fraxinus pennsylvanica]|uniref:Uncharacterized protein n=1 Tax=Fraxinus pennsylvanica TaxID=56036 RepID=A0AAD2DIH3_9LAMI|nr:unnamed protein product [Fraxinus pennsylvanica]
MNFDVFSFVSFIKAIHLSNLGDVGDGWVKILIDLMASKRLKFLGRPGKLKKSALNSSVSRPSDRGRLYPRFFEFCEEIVSKVCPSWQCLMALPEILSAILEKAQ